VREDDHILDLRLHRQLIEHAAGTPRVDPAGVVAHLGAVQAQDYPGALWSVGLRAKPGTTAADVERAIAERLFVRTWPMRGTLHFVAPGDVRWMLALLSDRVLARATARHAQLGLTGDVFDRAAAIFAEALAGGQALTRGEMMALLVAHGIDTAGQRSYHILWTLALRAVLCCGPIAGRQQTFVLLDEWVPAVGETALTRPEALGRLATRYFTARGPATLADFAWWAGITKADARVGLEATETDLVRLASGDTEYWLPRDAADASGAAHADSSVHLLPGFDEYFLGYTDRTLQLGEHRETYGTTVSANGMFRPTIVIGGRVAGLWKRGSGRTRAEIEVRPFRTLTTVEQRDLAHAVGGYGRYLGLPARVVT